MSWYSDREKFNEKPDPPYCRFCKRVDTTKEVCDRCVKAHEEVENDETD